MAKNLEEKFKLYCNSENLEINQNQIIVIKKLQDYFNKNFKKPFFNFLSKQDSKKAFYIFGDVGVGKTMILDFFYNSLNEKKKRNHFNEFMLNFHNFAHDKKDKGNENIIDLFVKNIKSKFSLIYFDEFQVTNIVDAMILGKLFQKIFDENLKIIVTSNTKISELYKDGLQRDQFKPFIKIMEKNSIEHELIISDDSSESLEIKGRIFEIKKFYEGISRFNFQELCNKNLGAEDYLEISKKSKFIIIEEIPSFNDINSNQQQRFITLIDIIYDRNISIAVTAEKSLEKLTSSRSLEKPFKRTISRLYELTSKDYQL
jgi:cell division protein ZapE